MKKIVWVVITVWFFAGCAGPRFASEAQYDKGEWKGNADLHEVAKIKRDKSQLAFDNKVGAMAFQKLQDAPVYTANAESGASKGYKGIIANRSNYHTVQIIIKHAMGYELGSYVLGPGDFQEDYLLAGNYCVVTIVDGQRKKKTGKLTSGPRVFKYFGKDYHWYAYYVD